jgi:uncharacterized membrane protein YeaQ/YmgE (transglycosylase-associated protein family)
LGLINWILVGAIAGLLAHRIVPGADPGRFAVTVLLGMAGAPVGGFVVGILVRSGARVGEPDRATIPGLSARPEELRRVREKSCECDPRRPGAERPVKPLVVVPTCGAEALKIA